MATFPASKDPSADPSPEDVLMGARPDVPDDDQAVMSSAGRKMGLTGAYDLGSPGFMTHLDQIECQLLRVRGPVVLLIHAAIFATVFPLAYIIRFDGDVPPHHWFGALAFLPVLIALKLAVFVGLGSHRGWFRYNTFADMLSMVRAASLGSMAVIAAAFLLRSSLSLPRSVIVIDWAGTMIVVGGLRAGIRQFRESLYPRFMRWQSRPTLIVGASEAGAVLAREVHRHPELNMRVVGFLDDAMPRGLIRGGVKVRGPQSRLREVVSKHNVEVILVPSQAVPPQDLRTLMADCNELGVRVLVVPGFDALLSGNFSLQPRDIDLRDLLCREPVELDDAAIAYFLRGRSVLITGAAGSIGSELCRQVIAFGPERLILIDHSENGLFFIERELRTISGSTEVIPRIASITDPVRLRTLFEELRPDVVLHAAAHKHVPIMEANPGEAIKNNVFGTRILVDEAIRADVESFVMISTDKAVNPTSVMGACKRLAEMYVEAQSQRVKTRLITVRFGNVLGSNGSVVPLFRDQIKQGGPITVTDPEMTRYFMTIPEASQLVLQAGAQGWGGEIFVLDMGRPVRVLDLARDLIRLSGMTEGKDIEIRFTGLRPGEKLYEELYDAGEEQLPTPHPKIFSARQRPCSPEQIEACLSLLTRVVEDEPDRVIASLQEVLPEYRPAGDNRRVPDPIPVPGQILDEKPIREELQGVTT